MTNGGVIPLSSFIVVRQHRFRLHPPRKQRSFRIALASWGI